MDTIYLQFSIPKSPHHQKADTTFIKIAKKILIGIFKKIIPVANPDFENHIFKVYHWLIECDRQDGTPQREIGVDSLGQVIMIMPFKNNYGYWTDNNLNVQDFKEHFNATEIDKELFEQKWSSYENTALTYY